VKQFLVVLLVLAAVALVVSPAPVPAQEGKAKGTVEGTVLAAETNQPVSGVSIDFRRRFPKKPVVMLRRSTDEAGRFTALLPVGVYDCVMRKEGFGTSVQRVEVTAGETTRLPAPLNREARIAGRLMDGAGKSLAGMKVSFGARESAVTDSGGRFSVAALDAGWYELNLDSPLWVVEKQVSLSVAAGEKKDLGNVTLRRAGSVTVTLAAADRGAARYLSGIEVNLSGGSVYRYGKTDKKGVIAFDKLPPGSYAVESSDERLAESKASVEVVEGKSSPVRMPVTLRPPSLSMDDSGRVILPDKAVPVSLRGLWVERARLAVYAVDDAGLMDGTVDPDRLEGIPASAMRLVKEREVILKKGRFTVYRSASLNLDPLPPGYYIMEAVGGGARGRSAFLVTRFGVVAKASRSGALLFAADLLDGRARPAPR